MGVKVISGDLPFWGSASPRKRGANVPRKRRLSLANVWSCYVTVPIESIELVAQNQVKQGNPAASGCVLGLAFNLLIGPLGFLLGPLVAASGSGGVQQVTFSCRLRDGRQFMAVCDPATYQQFLAAAANCGATLPGQAPKATYPDSIHTGISVFPVEPTSRKTQELTKAPMSGRMQIFIARPDKTHGPYRLDEVNRFLAAGQLSPSDLAWFEGCVGWLPLAQIQGVQLPPNTLPPPSSPPVERGMR